jgi:nitrile hydratase accessory protein
MSGEGARATAPTNSAPESTAGAGGAADRRIADMAGPSALPRKNGELVFESAWAARLFGMTVALNQGQQFPWNQFRDRLIDEIATAERQGVESSYYARWFAAFERLLGDTGLVSPAELEARAAEFECGHRDDVF